MASVLSVLEEQLVLQGLANNEPEIQRKKKKPGFNYTLYHRNKTNLDTYKSDVTTNDVFFKDKDEAESARVMRKSRGDF